MKIDINRLNQWLNGPSISHVANGVAKAGENILAGNVEETIGYLKISASMAIWRIARRKAAILSGNRGGENAIGLGRES
jgi:hypothetical protein